MVSAQKWIWAPIVIALFVGCGGSDDPEPSVDAGVVVVEDAGVVVVADGGLDGGLADTGVPRDAGFPAPTERTCANPATLTPGTPATGSLADRAGLINPTEPDCPLAENFTYEGPDAVYSVSVAAQSRLILTLDTAGAWDSALLVMEPNGCAQSPVCLSTADREVEDLEFLFFDNNTDAPRALYVGIEGLYASGTVGDPTTYTLTASVTSAPAGNKCEAPVAILAEGTVRGTITSAVDNLAPAAAECPGLDSMQGAYQLPDVFYSLTVPANTTVTASVSAVFAEGETPIDLVIYMVDEDQCGVSMPTCLAASDVVFEVETPESITYTNTTAAARDVLIGVEAFSLDGDFDLDVRFD